MLRHSEAVLSILSYISVPLEILYQERSSTSRNVYNEKSIKSKMEHIKNEVQKIPERKKVILYKIMVSTIFQLYRDRQFLLVEETGSPGTLRKPPTCRKS